jgi:uncharacterized membrane protein
MAEQKSKNWISDVVALVSSLFDSLVEHSNEKIHELKKKALHFVFVYGMFFVAVLFIIIGLIKYLTDINVFASEGIAFLVFGSVMIVILAAYSLIARV